MDKNMLEKLEYEKLKEIVKGYCVSGLGKELIDKLKPSSNIKTVKRRLDETSEGRRLIDASYHVPLEGISNISPYIDKMDKGVVLDPSDLTAVSDFLRGSKKLKMFMKDKEGYAPTLSMYGDSISDLSSIEEEINYSIRGSIVDSKASKELGKIRRHIDICESNIKEKLDKFLKSPSNKNALSENFVSKRNGRYTVPIKSSFKNQISGNIIEISPKGNTVFIEPSTISKYTTELELLKIDENVEEYRILSNLTNLVYEKIHELKINRDLIAEFDMIMAKSKYSVDIDGIQPHINDTGYIKIIKGRFPFIKNSVPLDFEIGRDYRSLIITGPNAGGKTVVLKTVGILTLSTLSGFHICADKETSISIFKDIFVDIGDGQSVDNALSTFSSHVKNLSEILRKSGNSTLLLFDEIGSGTEPNEGAALAIALLEEFYHKGCITIATTHYGEIKNYSENHDDFENAAMEFRSETLEPLYKLHIGRSGDSNALYISKKMGIPDSILNKARVYIDTKDYNYSCIKESKVRVEKEDIKDDNRVIYNMGDRVTLLDFNKSGIVFKGIDEKNNVTVFYDNDYKEVNIKRIRLEQKASELYPEGYDMEQLFVSFKERKLKKDIERGSKKALKKIQKESRV